jgi:hypothetical protein
MCSVPPRPAEDKKTDQRQPADAADFADDGPAAPVLSAARTPVTAFAPQPAGKGLATCPHCGEMVRAVTAKRSRHPKCPVCGTDWPAPASAPKPPSAPVPLPPPPDEFAGSTPDEDPDSGNPYRTADGASRRCPGCRLWLSPEIVVCVRCGFDLRLGRKHLKEYQRLERRWNSGISLGQRLLLFGLCQAAALTAIAVGFVTVEDTLTGVGWTFGLSWITYTSLTAFLMGSFDSFELKRHRSGRVDLVRTWRFGFIARPPDKIDVRDYFGVVNAVRAHVGLFEWFVFIFLLLSCLIPALVYWYCVMYRTEYTVALTSVHGVPEVYVYRGTDEEQMLEITQTLRDAMTV